MTRLENIFYSVFKIPLYCLEDIKWLRKEIPELEELSDTTIYGLWHNWGEYCYSASWFNMTKEYIEEFREFILEEDDETDWIFDAIN